MPEKRSSMSGKHETLLIVEIRDFPGRCFIALDDTSLEANMAWYPSSPPAPNPIGGSGDIAFLISRRDAYLPVVDC